MTYYLETLYTFSWVELTTQKFTWRHDQVLQCLALALEGKRSMNNKSPPVLATEQLFSLFCPTDRRQYSSAQMSNHQEKVLTPILAQDNWKLLGPGKCWLILINGLFFHLRLPPLTYDQILICGLDQQRKKLRYAHLATEAEPGEESRFIGFSGQELRRTVKNLSEAAESSATGCG